MNFPGLARLALLVGLVATLSACSGGLGSLNPFGQRSAAPRQPMTEAERTRISNISDGILTAQELGEREARGVPLTAPRETIGSLLRARSDGSVGSNVNRYLWNASLDVLSFLPVETVDPFSGVIATGYGTPPGGGRAYRATIYISDPALDARSLRIAMQGRGGAAVSPETVEQIEAAILTRARQLRVRDSRL